MYFFIKERPRPNSKGLAVPNLDLKEKIKKVVVIYNKFEHFLHLSYSNFTLKLLKTLELPKLSNKSSLKRAGAS